jgi:hypothetical protein
MKRKSYLDQFLEDRTKALLSMDKYKIVAYFKKYGGIIPKSEEMFWAGVHQARTALKDLPDSERIASEKWLLERGFDVLPLRYCNRDG